MSRLDPGIAMGVRPPAPTQGPMDGLGQVMQMKNVMQQGRLNEQSLELGRRQLVGEQRKSDEEDRKLKADQALRDAMQQSTSIGEDGEFAIDHDRVAAAVTRAGFPEKALEYTKMKMDLEKSSFEHVTAELGMASAKYKRLGEMAASVLAADPQLRGPLYSVAIKNALAAGLIDKKAMEQIPQEYAGPETDALLQQIADAASGDPWGQQQKRMVEQRAAAEEKRKVDVDARAKATHDATLPGVQADAKRKQIELASQALGGAKSQADWDNARAQLDETTRNEYPTIFSNEAREAAAMQGISPDVRANLQNYNSDVELATAAARGDLKAAEALKTLEERDIRVERAKELAKADAGGLGNGLTGTGPTGQRDESVLANVSPEMANYVKALTEGRAAWPTGAQARSAWYLNAVKLASVYEPGFDANMYKQRSETVKDFNVGQGGRNVTAINTVTGHLDNLNKAAKQLDNGSWRLFNSGKNWLSEATGNPKMKKFQLAVNAVADEMERVFRGTGGTLEGINAWKQAVSAADSPQQLDAAIKQAVELMGSRLQALREQYQRGMGRAADFRFLDEKSRGILERLVGKRVVDDIDPAPMQQSNLTVRESDSASAPVAKQITPEVMAIMRKNNPGVKDEDIVEGLVRDAGYARPRR